MTIIEIQKPHPHCLIPAEHGACLYRPVTGGHSDIRKTWERHAPGWYLQRSERQQEQHGAEKP